MNNLLDNPDSRPIWPAKQGKNRICFVASPGSGIGAATGEELSGIGGTQKGEGCVTGICGRPKPGDNMLRFLVNVSHEFDLMGAFGDIDLVDADGVDPEELALETT